MENLFDFLENKNKEEIKLKDKNIHISAIQTINV